MHDHKNVKELFIKNIYIHAIWEICQIWFINFPANI